MICRFEQIDRLSFTPKESKTILYLKITSLKFRQQYIVVVWFKL